VSGEDVLKLEELRAHREALSRMSLPMRRVAKAVCDEFHVRADELIGESRKLRLVRPRQVAIHLLMWRSDPSNPWSLNRIGRVFRRDHTTVLNDDRRIRALVVEDAELAATVARLKEGLQ
jgi:chromosomal replication initiation ATPase DnaA